MQGCSFREEVFPDDSCRPEETRWRIGRGALSPADGVARAALLRTALRGGLPRARSSAACRRGAGFGTAELDRTPVDRPPGRGRSHHARALDLLGLLQPEGEYSPLRYP